MQVLFDCADAGNILIVLFVVLDVALLDIWSDEFGTIVGERRCSGVKFPSDSSLGNEDGGVGGRSNAEY